MISIKCQYTLCVPILYNKDVNKKYLIALLAIMALGAFLRFYHITSIPPGLYPDEAMNGTNGQEAVATGHFNVFYPENNGREGLFINIQAISVAALGNTPWALRLVSAIIGTLTILGVYLVTTELFANNFQSNNNESILKRFGNWKLEIRAARSLVFYLLSLLQLHIGTLIFLALDFARLPRHFFYHSDSIFF